MMFRILIVDDDDLLVQTLSKMFKLCAARVAKDIVIDTATSLNQAHDYILSHSYSMAFVDAMVTSNQAFDDGLDFARYLRRDFTNTVVVVMSGYPSYIAQATQDGFQHVIQKRQVPLSAAYDQIKQLLLSALTPTSKGSHDT